MDDIIWYLKSKEKGLKNSARIFADNILKFHGEDFTAAIDIIAEELGCSTTVAHRKLLADSTVGKYTYIPN